MNILNATYYKTFTINKSIVDQQKNKHKLKHETKLKLTGKNDFFKHFKITSIVNSNMSKMISSTANNNNSSLTHLS